jgi:hypothetical protein
MMNVLLKGQRRYISLQSQNPPAATSSIAAARVATPAGKTLQNLTKNSG